MALALGFALASPARAEEASPPGAAFNHSTSSLHLLPAGETAQPEQPLRSRQANVFITGMLGLGMEVVILPPMLLLGYAIGSRIPPEVSYCDIGGCEYSDRRLFLTILIAGTLGVIVGAGLGVVFGDSIQGVRAEVLPVLLGALLGGVTGGGVLLLLLGIVPLAVLSRMASSILLFPLGAVAGALIADALSRPGPGTTPRLAGPAPAVRFMPVLAPVRGGGVVGLGGVFG